jgi:hypothetical protein
MGKLKEEGILRAGQALGAAGPRSPRSRRRGTSGPRRRTIPAQPLREYGTNGSIDQPYGRTAKSLLHITSDVIVSGMYPCENTRASTDRKSVGA